MKAIVLILLAAVVVVLAGCQIAAASPNASKPDNPKSKTGQQAQSFKKTITKTIASKYLHFLPEAYGKSDKEGDEKWPLMMFLHGAGERGNNLELLKKLGPPKIVETDKDFPFIVVSPQCPKESWWPAEEELLINLLDSIIEKYDVDPDRVYLTGLSMGGYGTWHLGCAYPDRFAAIVPICGGGSKILACKLKYVPVWAFHGAKDSTVPLRESQDMVDRLKKCGGDVKLTIYPEAGHDSWTETYDNPQLYKWLLSYRKEKK
ncbi:MAG: prolyl oligopeptidase family serine peptidase [Planctomycetes bacterium]|nr:prolyl oligopeptidase family serine peptidase [Planctomycetota bacterium]